MAFIRTKAKSFLIRPSYASSIAFPMSRRMYLFSKFTHSAARYAFSLASFNVAPLAVTP